MNAAISPRCFRLMLAALCALVLAGCATAPKINWAARVGNYTFDQAVTELGPPDKQAALADHSVVAEWLTRHGRTYSFVSAGYGTYPSPYGYGPGYPTTVDTTTLPDYFLRLTFGPDGQLKSWKEFVR